MEEVAVQTTQQSANKKKSSPATVILVVVIVLLTGAIAYLYYQFQQSQKELVKFQDPEFLSQLQKESTQAIIDKVKILMLLPDEAPTVATLIDVDALREENPEFYADGNNGDMLLVFTKKAVLYRESDNLIINVAPVFLEPPSTDTTEDTVTTTTEDPEATTEE